MTEPQGLDWAVVSRLSRGERIQANRAEVRAAVEHLWFCERLTKRELATRLGISFQAAAKATERANKRRGSSPWNQPARWRPRHVA